MYDYTEVSQIAGPLEDEARAHAVGIAEDEHAAAVARREDDRAAAEEQLDDERQYQLFDTTTYNLGRPRYSGPSR